MKQADRTRSELDLEALERELGELVVANRTTKDDPLAELARIVGQDDPFAGLGGKSLPSKPRSFDDFLNSPPEPAMGSMPVHTPAFQPLFPATSAPGVKFTTAEDHDLFEAPAATNREIRDVGLRGTLEPDVEDDVTPAKGDVALSDADFEDELKAELDFSAMNTSKSSSGENADALEVPEVIASDVTAPEFVAALDAAPTAAAPQKGGFDDMLAEFEAAMRDVGAEKAAVIPPPPSLEPIVVPPPPAFVETPAQAIVMPEIETRADRAGLAYGGEGGLSAGTLAAGALAGGVIAAGAGAVSAGSGAVSQGMDKVGGVVPKSNRGMMIAGGVVGIAVIGIASLLAFSGPKGSSAGKEAVVVAAKPGVTKERPANPGGVEVPNQDKEVLQPRSPTSTTSDRVAPREEQPVDLTQAQRQAAQQALAASASGVRQIPGVAIVAPVSTTPPATAPTAAPVAPAAPVDPVPRPVASVPITIAGQSAPVATPAPVAPPPVVRPAAPAAAPAAAAPAPIVQAAPASPNAATPPAAPAEPRRVRAVPIRADSGEATPNRAQSQPRVVPAAPRAPEPALDDPNAPLRITPQANRLPRGEQVAAARPAAEPAAAPPQATQSTGGSGFSIQLAAEGSEEAARSKFGRMRTQHTSVLGGLNPSIRSAEVNGRSVYRLRVGGNLSRDEAVSLCERLKSDGGSCFVARN